MRVTIYDEAVRFVPIAPLGGRLRQTSERQFECAVDAAHGRVRTGALQLRETRHHDALLDQDLGEAEDQEDAGEQGDQLETDFHRIKLNGIAPFIVSGPLKFGCNEE